MNLAAADVIRLILFATKEVGASLPRLLRFKGTISDNPGRAVLPIGWRGGLQLPLQNELLRSAGREVNGGGFSCPVHLITDERYRVRRHHP